MDSDNHGKVSIYNQIMVAESKTFDIAVNIAPTYGNTPITTVDECKIDSSDRFVHYISDIHLDHKIISELGENHSDESVESFISTIVEKMFDSECKYYRSLLLIAGDISHTKSVTELFLSKIREHYSEWNIIYVLGNHELWGTHLDKPSIKQIYSDYDFLCRKNTIVMLDCAIYMISSNKHILMSYENICEASDPELRELLIKSEIIILGGTGYAKNNPEFNANHNIYRDTLSRDDEVQYSTIFNNLYERILNIARDLSVIVLTHMPKSDWGDDSYNSNWIYVSGHTHNNISVVTDDLTLYSDNQIGYFNHGIYLKRFLIGSTCDIFRDFEDGIYNISTDSYRNFYAGIKKSISMNRQGQIVMLKRSGLYMFILKNKNDKCLILNGGQLSKGNHSVEYYYDKMIVYKNKLEKELGAYQEKLESISEFIKMIGGTGTIHGCIVDITFNSHIYLNPLDLTVTPYYAIDMIDKYAFKSVPSLLFAHCPLIYNNVTENAILPDTWNNEVDEACVYYPYTDIYRFSRIIRGHQYALSDGIIRKWDDSVLKDENERLLRFLVESE